MSIEEQDRLLVNPSISTASFPDALVSLDIQSGDYCSMNLTGSYILSRIEDGLTVAEIIRAVCDAYDMDAKVVQPDVTEFIHELLEEGLVIRDDAVR